MRLPGRHRQLRRGTTFIEVMVAGLLLSIGMMALVNMWAFSYRVTINTDDKNTSYNIGRRAMEEVKRNFTVAHYDPSTMVGTTTSYYDAAQVKLGNSTGARFTVTTVVSSDGATPPLYTASVSVTLTGASTVLYQSATYLAKAGI